MTERLRRQADPLRSRIQDLLGYRQPGRMAQGENVNDRLHLLETYLRRLEQSLAKLDENQRGIVGYSGKDDHGALIDVNLAIQQNQALILKADDVIIDVQHEIEGLRQRVQQNVNAVQQPLPPDSAGQIQNGHPASQGQQVQNGDQAQQPRQSQPNRAFLLPEIKVPKFDGDVAKWPDFWSVFRVVIHKNGGLTNVEKMLYLLGQLEGTARAAVPMAVTEENYAVAVQILERRFGNRELIVNAHWVAFIELPPPSENADVKQLREFYDKVENHLGVLEQMGEDTDNPTLKSFLLSKLPAAVQVELRRGKMSNTRQLRTRLNEYLLAKFAEAATQIKPVKPNLEFFRF